MSGSGPIFLEQLDCSEDDSSVFGCMTFTPLGLHSCDHSQDAGVRCTGTDTMRPRNGTDAIIPHGVFTVPHAVWTEPYSTVVVHLTHTRPIMLCIHSVPSYRAEQSSIPRLVRVIV